ncbi:hypothetical protein QF048_002195 [Streptomyces sp. W4I9-2]|nr:hypothetical protein [Streptomyces sp. W4I9-2]
MLITTTAAAPSEICEEVPAVIVPSLAKAGRSLARVSAVVSGADALVLGEEDRVALALRDLDRGDLGLEETVLLGGGGPLVGLRADRVLGGAVETEAAVVLLGRLSHRDVLVRVGEAVVRHRVQHLDRAVLVALAGLGEQVRGVGHGLLATGDHHVELPGADELVGQRDGVEPGQAHLVDGERGDVHRDAGLDRGLPGGHLARTGREHLAHDHVLDLVTADAGPVQGGLDGEASEVGAGEALEGAEETAHGRPGARDDH